MAMAVDLTPKQPRKVYGGDGGAYYEWSPADVPMLSVASIGAAKLALAAGGLALPSYSDSAKVAYVLQGAGTCGIVLPAATKEKVVAVKEGDALALPLGVVTWWHNGPTASSDLTVLFLGDTSKGHRPGQFTDFQLTGSTGFSTEFVSRAWDLPEADAAKLVSSQPASGGVVKVKLAAELPAPSAQDRDGMVLNCLEAPLDVDIPGGGRAVVLSAANLPLVKEVGLGADLVHIDPHAMCSPGFSCDAAYQVSYTVRGSGRVQVVGPGGDRVLDTRVEGGSLFVVPRFHVVCRQLEAADASPMEWFSVVTTPNPMFSHLAGKTSVYKAISPEVVQASFNTTPEMEKLFRSKRLDSVIFFTPPSSNSSCS